ncbi:exodeoxyribonuclease III [Desulfobaculum xiamenense]|nr:exodeoxyribonuclease III [Desulfobaculum xiamenense]
MKLLSWNVNGYRAIVKKGFREWLDASGADVVGIQETKADAAQLDREDRNPEGWSAFWNSSQVRKGYSGTACFCRHAPLSVTYGLPDERYRGEGRCIRLEYEDFHLFNIYFPNGGNGDERLQFKLGYYDAFLEHAETLRRDKPIVVFGDFNTAHKPIDLARPKENEGISGFLPIERAWLDRFVAAGYVDTFRMFDDGPDNYTWWSYRAGARARNVGWRIDYFFVSEELRDNVRSAWIDPAVDGSDHCPLGVELEF